MPAFAIMSPPKILNSFGLGGVNLNQWVVQSLIEGLDVGHVLLEVLYPSGKDSSDASELIFTMGSLKCLFDWLFHEDDISWCYPSLRQKHCLVPCLWEVLDNPSVALAILHLNSFDKQVNELVVLQLSPISFHVLSELFPLNGVLIHETLNDLGHLEVNDSDLISQHFTHSRFTRFR